MARLTSWHDEWRWRSGHGWQTGLGLAGAALGAAAIFTHRQARAAERRLPPIGRFLEIDGIRLHYLDQGTGPALVFLHGVSGMIEEMTLSGAIDDAARRSRVVVFDRPGYGYSARPRTRLWTPYAQADLLARAFRALGLERPVIVGHSWGTLVALALALEHPHAVGGLVLLGGYYFPTPRADVPLFAPAALPLVGDVLRHTVTPLAARLAAERLIARMFAPCPVPARFISEFPLSLALRPWQLRATDKEAAMLIPAAAALCRRYGEIRHPVLIMAGADDRMVDTRRQSLRLHAELPQSALRLVSGVGHMVHHAVPEAVADGAAAMAAAIHGRAAARRGAREWLSDYRPNGEGTVPDDTLIDEAMADSFPASDPPAYMTRVRLGRPSATAAGAPA